MITISHLNNDFSGSTKVLFLFLKFLKHKKINFKLFISNSSKDGLLNDFIDSAIIYSYPKLKIKIFNYFVLLFSQFDLLIKLIRFNKNKYLYQSTLLCFGSNIFALFSNKKIIIHVHEILLINDFYRYILLKFNTNKYSNYIFVSNFQKKFYEDKRYFINKSIVIPNTVSFYEESKICNTNNKVINNNIIVTYIGPANVKKGFDMFLKIVNRYLNQNCEFIWVANSVIDLKTAKQFNLFNELSSNIKIYNSLKDLSNIYIKSNVILNLSNPKYWIETFGLTLLEGAYFGCIPFTLNIGGPKEIFQNNQNAFLFDEYNEICIFDKFDELLSCNHLKLISKNTFELSQEFADIDKFHFKILNYLIS